MNSSHPKPRLNKVTGLISSLVRPHRFPLVVSLLLIIVERFCSFAVPISSRYLINDVMYQHQAKDLPIIIGAVILATSLGALITYVLDRYLAVTGQRLVTELRTQVQEHVGRLPISFYDKNRTGALVARIMTDVESMRNLIGAGLLDFLGGIFTAVIALGILLRISLLMTALTVCIILALGWFLKHAFGITRPLFRERSRINAEVTGRLTESLGGIRVVKGYHAEASEARIFSEGAHRLLENITLSINAQAFMSLCKTMVLGVVAALIMYLGAKEVGSNHLDVGSYVEFTMLLAFMVAPIVMSVNIGTQLTEAFAGLDRTLEVLKEAEEDSEPTRTHLMESVIGHIAFRDVTFSYLPGKTVLHGLTFDSPPGTVTALVGSSGSGKSTVISLICGFHNANGGQVSVDNVDLSTIRLGRFREQLGVVLQETFLFDGTIRENVLFSRPGATTAQLLEACRIARVDEFAESFPDQYETIVGERGVKLSGGQRQRISIARAILADPRILILDEATSSLDSESEALIQSGLKHLMQGRTTFVIAHRLSTIRRADQILVLEKGRIVERGTHESLYREEGRYYDFYTRQHGVEANLFLAPGEGDKIM
ncbi:ABC transporter ATP-binding protein [Granulicella sp. L60]|uniref:ABC transporter ATP-binding protein n=1 Tax=Granulicella sp. L60 TaxID=1641866 RepID=UPI0020B159F6|nr:ABC transporter ATP-binding protein [Granulicella sp. L60]